jgi:putative radical SAM enzyme (TIGR03279 family)
MVKIERIIPDSTADKAGIKSEDKIITINGNKINDYIDYLYEISEVNIVLKIKREDGKVEEKILERKFGEELGIEFKEIIFDGLKQCSNNCIFCFVKQQPKNMRNTLNQKDDDYRFSFMQGSFITLTNLNNKEIERIINKNLSPLNISVHTTNPELRVEMMKNPKAAKINKILNLLKKNGIQFHTQIVLCPGYNDKKELDRTLEDLIELYPAVLSVGIVPVGLTKHRDGLPALRTLNVKEMKQSLEQIKYWQNKAEEKFGENFIYAADEFYLSSNSKLPDYEDYNDFPQLENGIGLTALIIERFKDIDFSERINNKKKIALVTGELGAKALNYIVENLNKINNLKLELIVVKNKFFGESVTVTGLLTAQDIERKIKSIEEDKFDKIIIPSIVLNDEKKFLDEVNFEEFIKKLEEYNIELVSDLEDLMEVIKDV